MSAAASIDLSRGREASGVLAFRGVDVAKFLQGQLSADVEKLAPGASTLAGLHNPQGRVIALLVLLRTREDEVLAVLPRDLLPRVSGILRKFVFRARVRIEPEDAWHVLGAPVAHEQFPSPAWANRFLWLVPGSRLAAAATDEAKLADPAALALWERTDIEAGLPQVYPATSESFVAQMLNLDLLGAIAFDKGCYTGQEVIARAHYRGRVKRRMQRWHYPGATPPRPGDTVHAPDGRSLTVVRCAPGLDGGGELLAVGTYASGAAPDDAPPAQEGSGPPTLTVSGPLPLPYALPQA
jgi:folate-binding protein YgfZ